MLFLCKSPGLTGLFSLFRKFNGGPPDPIDYGHDVSIV